MVVNTPSKKIAEGTIYVSKVAHHSHLTKMTHYVDNMLLANLAIE